MPETQRERARIFRELHHGTHILVLPNAGDAASARIFEDAGFPSVATSSAGVAFTLGYPDGQVMPQDEMLFMTRRIAQTVNIPVTADIEAGYGGDTVDGVVETVRGVIEAGAVGINLEDAAETTGELSEIDLQVERIKAIRALGESTGVSIVINARTDIFHLPGLDTETQIAVAVERAKAYFEAGADCFFVPFVIDAAIIERLVKSVGGPLNVLAMAGSPGVAELESLGVARVSIGGGPTRAALGVVRRIAEELRDKGTYTQMLDGAISYPEINGLLAK